MTRIHFYSDNQNTYIVFLLLIISVFGNSCAKNEAPHFHLESTSLISFNFKNVSDSLNLNIHNLPVIPSSQFNETTFVTTEEDKIQIKVPCEYPSAVNIFIGENEFTGFILPDDSLSISINLSDSSLINEIRFDGKTGNICQYFWEKQRNLGYQDLRTPLNMTSNNPKDILQNSDSLLHLELNYLNNNHLKSKLPFWFIENEKNQIIYLCNDSKKSKEAYITKYLKTPFNPVEGYYDYLDTITIDNRGARFSVWYFYFLKGHLVYRQINSENLGIKEWMDLTTKTAITQANKQLTGEIRDIFKYDFLLKYLNWTKSLDDFDQLIKLDNEDFYNTDFKASLLKKRDQLTDSIVHKRGDELQNISKKSILPNDTIPYFYLPNIDGQCFSPKNFEGKIVYINFWATWCKSCVASIPHKNELIKKFSNNKNVKFLNICLDSEQEKWQQIIIEKEMGGINLFANKNWSDILKQKFQIESFPTHFLIKNNKIIKPFCDGPINILDDIKLILD